MTKNIKTLACIAALAVVVTIAGCTRTCDLGYEGDHCTDQVRTKYYGLFSGSQTCGSATDTFSVAFGEVVNDVTKVRITNIYNANNLNALGSVLENGSITIAPQAFGAGGTINGTVTLVNGKINVAYHITATGLPDADCTWVQN